MGQKFAAYGSSGEIVAFYDNEDSPLPASIERAIEITGAQWQACLDAPGWTVVDGTLAAPTKSQIEARQAADAWASHQADAMAALDDSDTTILRCYENGVVVPQAWAAYRQALREVVGAASGDPSQGLPQKPPYPSGT
jgi:hypothetical protein